MMSLVRLRLLTGTLENDFRLRPRQHVVLQGYIPCRLKPRVLLNHHLRPCVRRGIHRLELDCLPDGLGNQEHRRHEAEDSAPRHDPTIHWNSSTIIGTHDPFSRAAPRSAYAVVSLVRGQGRPRRALQGDFRAGMGSGIRARQGAGSGPVAAPVLRPFYGQAPPPARLGLHSARYACPPRDRLCAKTGTFLVSILWRLFDTLRSM